MATIFCRNYSMCEAPISVIVEILSKNDPLKYEMISIEFKSLGLNQVKDLAKSSIEDVSKILLDGEDPLFQLYDAMRVFDLQCDEQFKIAESEYHQGHYKQTEEICLKLLLNQQKLEILLLLAASYFQSKEYDKSMEYYKKAYAIKPDCAEVSNDFGVNCFHKSQFEESIQHVLQAINLKHDNAEAKINCAIGYALMRYEEKSITLFEEILNSTPDLYKARNIFGKVLLSFKHIAYAKMQFKLSLKLSTTFPDIWFNLGTVYFNEKKYEKSIFHFQKALELDPNMTDAWANIGKTYYQLDRIHDALHAFKNACRLSPNDLDNLKLVAYMYYLQDNKPLSIETFEKCLELKPNDEDSNLLLAFMLSESDDTTNKKKAIKHFKKMIVMQPKNVEVYQGLTRTYMGLDELKYASETMITLGDIHCDDNNPEAAYTAYSVANYVCPENADSYWKMGLIAYQMGNDDEALKKYEEAKTLRPIFPDVYVSIALIFEKKNLIERAVEYYNIALILEPNHENALLKMSIIKHKLGCLDEVVRLHLKMISLDSSNAFKYSKLANIFYMDIGNLNNAIVYYQKALAINEKIVHIYLNMGYVYLDLKKSDKALFSFKMAFSLDPTCIIAKTNIGSIHKNNENFTDAIKEYEAVLTIEPDFPDAYCNLVQCLQQVCNWSDYDIRISKLMNIVSNQLDTNIFPSLLPHHSLLYPFSHEVVKKISSKYAEQIVKKPYIARKLSQDHYIYSTLSYEERLHVGYVSSDFGGHHPIAQLMRSIAKFHNGNEIEVFCYSLSPNDNSTSWSEISTKFDNHRDFSGISDIEAANQINCDSIHILVNMNGYTKGARNEIFALRPAPIQVLWLGYPSTSGATFIDYLITDEVCSPPELQDFYTEKFMYMNRSVFIGDHKQIFNDLSPRTSFLGNSNQINGNIDINDCGFQRSFLSLNKSTPMHDINISPESSSPCHTRQKHNLPEGVVVYCNFSQLYKIVPSTFNMWAIILRNVPNSVLWLLRFPPDGEHNLRKYAAEQNIDLSRIIFGDLETKDTHMRRIQLADIFLDTPLYNGHTTCLDALWTGTPVITLPGNTFASRVAASLLTTLGYKNTIAVNEKHYIEIATEMGLNKGLLKDIRLKMWRLKTESELFDCKSYTQELENIYKKVWNNYNAIN